MAYNYSKLNGKIVEVYGTQCAFASALGISEKALSNKLNNKSRFDQAEITKACKLLSIPDSKTHVYFFTLECQAN